MGREWSARIGWIVSALVVVILLADVATMLFAPQRLAEPMRETGFPLSMVTAVAIPALAGAVLYAIPRTAVLGAILITGFVGGAIATHVRIGEVAAPPQIFVALLGIATWGGLYLRDARLRSLFPWRVPAL